MNRLKKDYNLQYHLKKTNNLRLQAKVRALVRIIPEKYNSKVKFTKRLIWFSENNRKFIQVFVGKEKLFIKIKIDEKWEKLNFPDWEDFRRVFFYLRYFKKN